jgi:outer membrane protein assembly factor BamD
MMYLTRFLKLTSCLIMAAVLLSSCSMFGDDDERSGPDANLSEDQLYLAIQNNLEDGRYDLAAENLQALEARYPFGVHAEQAQLQLIYTYYMQGENEAAYATAERFIRLHPQHPQVDYAYYMKGLAAFTEGKGFFERFFPTDLTMRDPGSARRSFADFSQLLSRFPDSPYAADAKRRMIYLRNLLARYEIHVANYYFERRAYLAAANRGRYVVENFQRTPAVPDALATMVQAYTLLGMDELASDAFIALKTNYPEHPAIGKHGEFVMQNQRGRSLLNKMTFGLADQPPPKGYDTRPDKKKKKKKKKKKDKDDD